MTAKRFYRNRGTIWENDKSLSLGDVEDRLNELHEENQELRDMELEDRDIVCGAGKFRLEEWGKHRYHQFYKGDEELEDETVVIMLMEFEKENKELKKELGSFKPIIFETENGATT